MSIAVHRAWALVAFLGLAACGGGGGGGGGSAAPTASYTVSATVSGLIGTGLQLRNNAADTLSVGANSTVTFATPVANGATYNVVVLTQPSAPAQSCVVTNGAGTIGNANVNNVTVTCTTNAYAVGGTVSGLAGTGLVLQNNAGDDLSVAPAASSFTFAGAVASGGAYDITVALSPTNPVQKCTVSNGSGTVTSAAVTTATVTCITQYPRFAYATNYYDGSLSIYYVDAATGQLRSNQLLKTGQSPEDVVRDRAGKYLYVLNTGTAQAPFGLPTLAQAHSSICAFRFDSVTHHATEISGSPYLTGGVQAAAARDLSIHPNDKFIYAVNGLLSNIDAFAINATTGALTLVPGSPFATGASPSRITFNAAGNFAYVTNRGSNNISLYSVDATTGAFTEVAASNRAATGSNPVQLTLAPSGKFGFVVNAESGTVPGSISAFSVNATTGALTAVAGGPVGIGVNPHPREPLLFNRPGNALYVRNMGIPGSQGSLSAFSIDAATGALAPLSGSPYPVGINSTSFGTLGMDPAGKFFYVANREFGGGNAGPGSISAFSIDQTTGALTSIAGLATMQPNPFIVSVDPSGKFLYQTSIDTDQLYSYSIDSNGGLTPLSRSGVIRAGSEPLALVAVTDAAVSTPVVFKPTFAYVPNAANNNVSAFAINPATGALSDVGGSATDTAPRAVATTQDGKFAFVVNAGASPATLPGTVRAYTIAATGGLTPVAGSLATGVAPSSITTEPRGRYVYVANAVGNSISAYTIDRSTGALAANGSPTGTTAPIAVTVDPTGRNLYALSGSQIAIFAINGTTGALQAPVSGPASTALGVTDATHIKVDPNGRFLYVSIPGLSKAIQIYPINTYNGTLGSPLQVSTGRLNSELAIDPTGRFAYTADLYDNTVTAYTIDQSDGSLTLIDSPIPVVSTAVSVTTDYSGKFLYVVLGNNTVATYAIGTSGALTLVTGGGAATGMTPGPIVTIGTVE